LAPVIQQFQNPLPLGDASFGEKAFFATFAGVYYGTFGAVAGALTAYASGGSAATGALAGAAVTGGLTVVAWSWAMSQESFVMPVDSRIVSLAFLTAGSAAALHYGKGTEQLRGIMAGAAAAIFGALTVGGVADRGSS
jgi:hypothetical protein